MIWISIFADVLTQPVWNMHAGTHTSTHTHTHSQPPLMQRASVTPQFLKLVHAEQKHTELFSWLQNIFRQVGEFAVLQCFDQPAQLGCSALCLDEATEHLIGLLIQPFPLILVGQVVYVQTLQSPAALPQGPPDMLPLTAHSVRKALDISRGQHSVLWWAKG